VIGAGRCELVKIEHGLHQLHHAVVAADVGGIGDVYGSDRSSFNEDRRKVETVSLKICAHAVNE
jgi:hypothetical protein